MFFKSPVTDVRGTGGAVPAPAAASSAVVAPKDVVSRERNEQKYFLETSTNFSTSEINTRFNREVFSLNYKIAQGRLAQAAICSVGILCGWPYILSHGSWLLIAGSVLLAGHRALHAYRKSAAEVKSAEALESAPRRDHFKARAESIVEKLHAKSPLAAPAVKIVEDSSPYCCLHHRLFSRSIVVLSSGMERSTDRQLEGQLAHELSHNKRGHTISEYGLQQLQVIATPAIFFGSWVGLYGAAVRIAGGVLASPISLALAGLTWGAAVYGLHRAACWVSQNNELKTDLRAARLTNDPLGVIEGIKVFTEGLTPQARLLNDSEQFTHPSLTRRVENIRRVFGV